MGSYYSEYVHEKDQKEEKERELKEEKNRHLKEKEVVEESRKKLEGEKKAALDRQKELEQEKDNHHAMYLKEKKAAEVLQKTLEDEKTTTKEFQKKLEEEKRNHHTLYLKEKKAAEELQKKIEEEKKNAEELQKKLELEKIAAEELQKKLDEEKSKEIDPFSVQVNKKYGQYWIKKVLGTGTAGRVFLGETADKRSYRAFKVILYDPKVTEGKLSLGQKSVEAEAHFGVTFGEKCKHLVRYEDLLVRSTTGECVITMEYCAGGDLRKCLKQHIAEKKPFSEEELVTFLSQIGLAVQTLHKEEITHRDIKPENIFFLDVNGILKLGDYGLARFVSNSHTMSLAGTRGYIAPEVVDGDEDYTTSVDIYSLGIVLLEMIDLNHPFANAKGVVNLSNQAQSIVNIIDTSRCSPALFKLAHEMIDLKPEKRPTITTVLAYPPVAAYISSITD